MKRLSLRILFFKLFFLFVFISGNLSAQIPVITSFAPVSGPIGTVVTISGTNFNTTPADNIVWFGAVKATVNSATVSSLNVVVPAGANYQPITVTVNGLTAYSDKPFITTLPGLRIIDATAFASKVDFTTGTNPQGVAIGDIDGDGKPDIVVTNWGSDFVSVFRNNSTSGSISSGSFEPKVDFTVGGDSPFVALGDIDGDGKPDMVVASRTGDVVSVFRNSSTPGPITASSFESKVDFAAGDGPDCVAIGDIDSDGKPDLVVTNHNSNTVSVFRNTSASGAFTSGSFAPKVDFATGLQPYFVGLGDLDKDGKTDLVISNYNSYSISIYRNKSTSGPITTGSFDPRVDLITGSRPYGLAIGDIDGDNKPDISVVSTDNAVVSVFRNQSSMGAITSSSFSPKVDFPTGTAPYFVALGDINGDGKPDLVVENSGIGTVSILKNNSLPGSIGPGSFSARFDFAGGSSYGLAVGDLDSDGKQDIVVTNGINATVSVLHNEIAERVLPLIASFSPTFGPVGTAVTITGSNFSTTPANNTVWFGAVQATVTASTSTQLTVTVPAGASYKPVTVTVTGLTAYSSSPFNVTIPGINTFDATSMAPKVDFLTGMNPSSVAVADIDGDGKPDLIVTISNPSDNIVSVLRNVSTTGTLSNASFLSKIDLYTGSNSVGVTVSDIDGDGKQDIVVANTGSNSVSIFRNICSPGAITTGSFSARVDLITNYSPNGVAVGDLDGDGKPDLAVPNYMNNTVSVLRNNSEPGIISTGSFEPGVDFPVGSNPYRIAIGDLDGDGKPDLVVTNWGNNTVSILRNLSSAGSFTLSSFAPKVDFNTGTNPGQIVIADIDGDGKKDVTLANQNGYSFSIFRNISTSGSLTTSSLAPRADFLMDPSTGARALAVGDVDGDGKPDLVIGNYFPGNNKSYVFRNTSTSGIIASGSFAPRLEFIAGNEPSNIAIGDLDGDDKADLVVISANSISLLRNKLSEPLPPPPPSISSFTPISGIVGSTVTITGTGFSTTTSDNIVWFGAVRATVTLATTTQLTVTVPSGATYRPITVTVNGLKGYSKAPFVITFQSSGTINTTSFSTMVEFATGGAPWSVAVGDIDLDGKPDLAVVNSNSNSVSVYRNTSITGSIISDSFAARVDFITGNNPQHVAIGDVDGDSKPDLVVTNWGSNTVSVFRNISSSGSITSGSFAPKVDFATGNSPFKVCIGDLDIDGKPDLVVTNYIDGSFSVLKNTTVTGNISTSSFNNRFDFNTGINPYFASIGDLDGDGKPDLAVANFNSSTVSVFRNSSTPGSFGTSSFDPKVDFFTSIGTICPVIGDIDGDSKPDLAVLNSHTSIISVFRNISMPGSIGSGSFVPKVDFPTSTSTYSFSIGDFDGDGKADLAVTGGGVSIHRNTSTPGTISTSSFATKVEISTGDSSNEIAVCDFDGDSKPDFVVPNNTKNTISVFRNIIPEFAPLPPSITSFLPASGPIGSTVTISGVGFSTTPADNIVKFGTIQSIVTSSSATQLTVIVPAGATIQPINVTVSMLTANSATSFTVTAPASPPPVITNFNPISGASGSTVLINGSNFSTNISDNIVKFGSVQATVISATATQLTVIVPSGATTQPIYVTVNGLTAVTVVSFVISPPPVITSFLPTSGPVGTTITINGTDFSIIPTNNIVRFGTVQTVVSSASPTQLTVIVPAGAITQPIYVTVSGFTTNSTTDFTVTTSAGVPPVITSFSPASGPVGTTVIITGSNFGSDIVSNTVKFGTAPATIISAAPGQLSVLVPSAAITQPVFVTVNGLTAYSLTSFIVTAPPAIMSFSPSTGPVGTSVIINGTNFGPAPSDNTVMFGTVQATVTAATTTQLTVTVPSISNQQQISVTVNGLTSNSPTPFTVITPPAITSFSPSSGTVGSQVTITGSDFSFNISNNTVRFGNVQAAVINATTNQLTVIVPAGTTTQPISVTVNGLTATSVESFIIIYPPIINSLNPQSGAVGTSVTISGSNFSTTAANNTVRFGSVQATVVSATDTQINVIVPAGAITQPISLTVNGLTAYSSSPFNIPPQQPPVINSFLPTSGPVGTTVTITGSNFSTDTQNNTVWFGGAQATVTASTPTELTVTVPDGQGNTPVTVTVNGLTGNSNYPFNISTPGENPSPGTVEFESSVLTLNGDGINERLVIKNFESYGNCKLSVYNSRGVLIYSNKDYMNDWDMMIDNHVLDAGGYFYVLETDIGVFRGSFSILS